MTSLEERYQKILNNVQQNSQTQSKLAQRYVNILNKVEQNETPIKNVKRQVNSIINSIPEYRKKLQEEYEKQQKEEQKKKSQELKQQASKINSVSKNNNNQGINSSKLQTSSSSKFNTTIKAKAYTANNLAKDLNISVEDAQKRIDIQRQEEEKDVLAKWSKNIRNSAIGNSPGGKTVAEAIDTYNALGDGDLLNIIQNVESGITTGFANATSYLSNVGRKKNEILDNRGIGGKILAGLTGDFGYVFSNEESRQKDYDTINNWATNLKKQENEKVQKNIESTNSKVTKKVAELSPSMGNNLVGAGISYVNPIAGTAYFTTSAGGSYYDDAINRGMNEDQALLYGTAMGTMEGVTEQIPVSKMLGAGKNIGKESLKVTLKQYGISMAENAVQEAVIEPISELSALAIGGKETADFSNMGSRILKSGIDGALSSILLNGVNAGVSSAVKLQGDIKSGKQVTQEQIKKVMQDIQESGKVNVEAIIKQEMQYQTQKVKGTVSNIEQNPTQTPNNVQNLQQNAVKNQSNVQQQQISQVENKNVLNQNVEGQTETKFSKILNNKKLPMQSYMYEKSDNIKIDNLRKQANKIFNNSQEAHNYVGMLEKIITDKNVEIVFDANLKDENGNLANGKYENGVITINPNSNRVGEFIAIHELTHAIGTKALRKIVDEYRKSNPEFDKAVQKLLSNYNQTEITEEALSDVCAQLFGNQEYINNLATKNPNLFQKIYSEIKYLWHQFNGYKNKEQFVEDLMFKWEQAYRSNNKLNNTASFHISQNLNYDIDKVLKGEYNSSDDVKLRDYTPSILVSSGIKDLPMLMNQNHLKENILSATKAKKLGIYNKDANYHNLGKEIFVKAIDSLDNPLMIMKSISKNRENTYVIVTDVQNQAGEQIIVPVYLEGKGNYNSLEMDTNKIKTVYGKNDIKELVDNTIKGDINNIIYMTKDKNKKQLITTTGLQLSNYSNTASNNSITSSKQNVNTTKYSKQESENNSGSFNLPKLKEGYTRLYRGLGNEYDANYDKSKLDNSNGYESWTDNYELAKSYGENVYYIDVPTTEIKNSIINEDSNSETYGDRNLVYKNDKPVGINGKSGNEYMLYTDHDNYNNLKYNKVDSIAKDNQGRTLTKEQREYFKDSKVRDENGNLLTMYHGTPNGNHNIFKDGGYFTSRKEYADGYQNTWASAISTKQNSSNPKTYEVYLDIKNPFTLNNPKAKDIYINEYIKGGNSLYFDPYTDWTNDINNLDEIDWTEGEDLKEWVKENHPEYDGLILDEGGDGGYGEAEYRWRGKSYVPFNANQIKNVDNTNPTDNPDIRYSKDNTTWQQYLEKEFPARGTTTNLQDIKLPTKENASTQKASNMQEQQNINLPPPKNKTLNPTEIANLKQEDANTTVKLPQKESKQGNRVSNFFGNVTQDAQFLNEDLRKQISQDDGVIYYQGVTNEQTLNQAFKELQDGGSKATLEWFNQDSKKVTAKDTAKGWILLKQYQDAGDYQSAVEVAKKMREIGTNAGQTVQAFNILSRLTPEGMIYYAQSELSEAYEAMVKNKSKDWIDKNASSFDLTPQETQFIMDTMEEVGKMEDGYDKKVKLAEIQKIITDKIPPTKGQSIKAWMRISMLFNPKTQVRNIAGNATILPVNMFSDLMSTAIDKAISKKTGVRTTGMTNIAKYGKGFGKGLYESYNDFRKGINTRNIQGNRFEVKEGRSFKNKGLGKALNKVDNMLSFMLDAGDRGFYEATFTNSINNQLVLNKTTEVTQDMIDIATNEALQRTWQDNNEYTKAVLQIRKILNKFGTKSYGLGDVLIPFAKTPANLTKAIIDYSPVGLAKTITRDAMIFNRSLSNGQYSPQLQHKFVQNLGKGMAGTALYVLGYALAKAGIASGEPDDDKDVKNFMKNSLGISSYSIKIGDKSFTFDWAQPVATPLAIMTNYVKYSEDNPDAKAIEKALQSINIGTEQLLQQSFMESLNTVLNGNGTFVENLSQAVLDLPARAIPTFSKQIADMVDGTQRTTFEYNQPLQSAVNSVKAKIPGLSKTLPASVDTLGNEIQKYGGENNIFNVFFNPANVNKGELSKAGEEIYNIYQETGNASVFPRTAPYYMNSDGEKINMTAETRAEFQKVSGKYVENSIEKLLNNKTYKNLSDPEKAEIIEEIISDSYNKAKYEVLDIENESYSKTRKLIEKVGVADYYDYTIKTSDIEGSGAEKKKIKVLAESKYSNRHKEAIYEAKMGSDDELYSIMKETEINITEYLNYKTQEFSADKKDDGTVDGKSISGSKKKKVYAYVNNMKITGNQRLLLLGTQYKLTNSERQALAQYVKSLNITNKEKLAIYDKLQGFTVYKDGRVTF